MDYSSTLSAAVLWSEQTTEPIQTSATRRSATPFDTVTSKERTCNTQHAELDFAFGP